MIPRWVESSQICYPAGNHTDRHAADVILRLAPHEIKDTWEYICIRDTTISNGLYAEYADLMQPTDCSIVCILLAVTCMPIDRISLNYAAIIMNRNQN